MTSADDHEGAVIVAEASDAAEARIWVDALRDEGIEAACVERGPGGALGGASIFGAAWAVLVPRARIAEARGVIAELGGAHALVAYRTPGRSAPARAAPSSPWAGASCSWR